MTESLAGSSGADGDGTSEVKEKSSMPLTINVTPSVEPRKAPRESESLAIDGTDNYIRRKADIETSGVQDAFPWNTTRVKQGTLLLEIKAQKDWRKRWGLRAASALARQSVQVSLLGMLLVSMYLPDIWIASNVNSDADWVIFVILALIMACFCLEMVALGCAHPPYMHSFFFAMDVMGTLAVGLDYLWIEGVGWSPENNNYLYRFLRDAQIAARSGRIMKSIHLLWGHRHHANRNTSQPNLNGTTQSSLGTGAPTTPTNNGNAGATDGWGMTNRSARCKTKVHDAPKASTSKKRESAADDGFGATMMPGVPSTPTGVPPSKHLWLLSQRVSRVIAQRVALLTMVLVLLGPLLQAEPGNFLSQQAYVDSIDVLVESASLTATEWNNVVEGITDEFDGGDSYPMELTIDNVGSWSWTIPINPRPETTFAFSSVYALAYFNLTPTRVTDAWLHLLFTTLVLAVLLLSTVLFNQDINKRLIAPMERLLTKMRAVMNVDTNFRPSIDDSERNPKSTLNAAIADGGTSTVTETQMMESAIDKLAAIVHANVDVELTSLQQDQLGLLDTNTKCWIASEYTRKYRGHLGPNRPSIVFSSYMTSLTRHDQPGSLEFRKSSLYGLTEAWAAFQEAGFDPFSVMPSKQPQLLSLLLERTGLTGQFSDEATMSTFAISLASAYLPNPYHSFNHALDVLHMSYRWVVLCSAFRFLSDLEVYCLLVAAVAHDVRHPALTNVYLVNSFHSIALQHNDESPLENMHCATLFEMMRKPGHNVLGGLGRDDWREARRLIISAIMGTDMKHHFSQVLKAKLMFQMHGGFVGGEKSELPFYLTDPGSRHFVLELIIHASDISNSTKPFQLSCKWAMLIVDEFFEQGDREKKEQLQVSPMCDRHTVNIPNMQMGFIEFITTPLYIELLHLFPQLEVDGALTNLWTNMNKWASLRRVELRVANNDESREESKTLDKRLEAFETLIKPPNQAPPASPVAREANGEVL